MNIKRFVVLVVILLSAFSGQAMAHVVIPEVDGNDSVILHATPDDDPIAGKESTLFFSLKDNSLLGAQNTYFVNIENETGDQTNIPASESSQTISAVYTFPKTGLYFVTLNISSVPSAVNSADADYVFKTSMRITRGDGKSTLPTHPLAQAALVLSVLLFIILAIFAYKNRWAIVDHPEF